jgi:hypothetical protein
VDELSQLDVKRTIKSAMRTEIFREALAAYAEHETKLVQEDLEKRNIKSFSVSAETHMEWAEVDDFGTAPVMTIEACGILALRRFLYELPASSNCRKHTKHVFTTLPRLEALAGLVFEVHVEDNGYATMRQDLNRKIPVLRQSMENLISSQLSSLIVDPWSLKEVHAVHDDVQSLGEVWRLKYFWKEFEKMLRERGKPTNGKYQDRNLNDEICVKYRPQMENWLRAMEPKSKQLAQRLSGPPQEIISGIRGSSISHD